MQSDISGVKFVCVRGGKGARPDSALDVNSLSIMLCWVHHNRKEESTKGHDTTWRGQQDRTQKKH